MRSRPDTLGYVGLSLSVASAGLYLVADFAPYYNSRPGISDWLNLWHLNRSIGVVVLLLAIAALTQQLVAFFFSPRVLLLAGLVCAALNAGLLLWLPLTTNEGDWHLFGVSAYAGLAAAALGILGGFFMYWGSPEVTESQRRAAISSGLQPPVPAHVLTPPTPPAAPSAPPPPPIPALPPAGWYPDPADQRRQRLWSGTRWTQETQ